MGLMKDEDRQQLTTIFAEHLTNPVKLVMFTQDKECEFCTNTRELLEEVAELSDNVALEVLDFVKDADKAKALGVDKIPAIVLLGPNDQDFGIRFYGIPAGYEFTALVEDILDVAKGKVVFPENIQTALDDLNRPVHLQVMVSPTCPYCPKAVRVAHRFAMASDQVRADMVEVSEFPHLAVKYDVQGVPATIINETENVVGAVPEAELIKKIAKAVQDTTIN